MFRFGRLWPAPTFTQSGIPGFDLTPCPCQVSTRQGGNIAREMLHALPMNALPGIAGHRGTIPQDAFGDAGTGCGGYARLPPAVVLVVPPACWPGCSSCLLARPESATHRWWALAARCPARQPLLPATAACAAVHPTLGVSLTTGWVRSYQTPPSGGLMGAMDDSDHNTRSSLPAVVAAQPVIRTRRAAQRLTRWHPGGLPDRLRRGSQHPAVIGSLATAAGLLLHAGLRWALASQGQSTGGPGSAVIPAPSTVKPGESIVEFSRTVVVETWTVRSRRI
jgi:hypothetical protein